MNALHHSLIAALLIPLSTASPAFADGQTPWRPLFDGRSLTGWKVSEHPDSIRVEDGLIVCDGPRAHAFYTGEVEGADFRNFELRAEVRTEPGANSGIFFHTAWQESGFPEQGYEAQINNSYVAAGKYVEYKKTGSLYCVRNQHKSIVGDGEWFTMLVTVTGKRIQIRVNDTLVVDYTEPEQPVREKKRAGRVLSSGTFALQCHDPKSKVAFRKIEVRPLADDCAVPPRPMSEIDEVYRQNMLTHLNNLPLIDLHVHLKGGLTNEQALEKSRATGVFYGIAVNCGLDFPVKDDAAALEFLHSMRGQPCFIGMQAEGREWVDLFSPAVRKQFDYVFTDAMTFTDDHGRRIHLWKPEEFEVTDKQAFMEMIVDRIVTILENEPIDVYANATYLPKAIADDYDALWTPARMQRVIDALVKNGIALEIGLRSQLPSVEFIKRAKAAGVKFTFGSNNGGAELGRAERALEIIEQCELKHTDLWVPGFAKRKE